MTILAFLIYVHSIFHLQPLLLVPKSSDFLKEQTKKKKDKLLPLKNEKSIPGLLEFKA